MARIRSFAAPHKGLRNVISKFSFALGYTDFSDPQQLQVLKLLGHEMFTLLNDHVHTENEHTLKQLEERMKGASQHDKDDHERLEKIQEKLDKQLAGFTGLESLDDIHVYYLEFSSFHSLYLQHIYEEETITEHLLQQSFTDEELIQHRMSIMQKIKFPVLLLWLKYMIPAQPENESIGMLSGLKNNIDKDVFIQVKDTIRMEMDAVRFQRLFAQIEG